MPAPRRRGVDEKVEFVIVDRDVVGVEGQPGDIEAETPTSPSDFHPRSYGKRQASSHTDDYDSDDDDHPPATRTPRPTSTTAALPAHPTFLITTTERQPQGTQGALADNNPIETIIVTLGPPPRPPHDRDGRISQTTEHLLIAAGSIGATIIVVMIILALYTMRKRGLTFSDVVKQGKSRMRRGPPAPPSKYDMDKQSYENDYANGRKDSVYRPVPIAKVSRSSLLSTQRPLQALGRSESFNQGGLARSNSAGRSFYDETPSPNNLHSRNDSATPSSPVLPIQNTRGSASTRNTRSLDGGEAPLRYSDPPQQRPLPPPPTFRQFLSNRPSISQRPGLGGAIASHFSWTNSNAPQTPHDPTRDTVTQPVGRDSFMTQRSSVPRFRTVDSWVNQQSNRVEEQRLKQQFRMTQSSTSSDDVDQVPEMPAVPKNLQESSGLAGRNIKHQRHDTTTSVHTAPIFKAHPGTEVRFSVRSEVPSEVLDMGRKNAAL